MAEEPAKKAAPKKGAKSSGLSGSWHGVPKPVLAVGGVVGAYLVYRWYKNRSSSTAAATTATANPAATGTDTGTGSGYTGTGTGSGGGGGGWDPWGQSQPNQPAPTPAPTPAPAVAQAPAPAPVSTPTINGQPSTPSSTGTISSAPNQLVAAPNAFGSTGFSPTAILTQGATTYYGIGNKAMANKLRAAGFNVVGGKTVPGGNPGANYVRT